MPIKEIRYNSDNTNIIIEGRELCIKASDYIETTENEQKMYILRILQKLDYVFYRYIQDFVQRIFDVSVGTINYYLRELEVQGMINTYTVNSNKYAMLGKKGTVLITGNPDAIPRRTPQINNLKIQAYMSELSLNYSGNEIIDLKNPYGYLNFYKEYYMRISKCNGFDEYDNSDREVYKGIYHCLKSDCPARIKGIKKEITKDMCKSQAVFSRVR